MTHVYGDHPKMKTEIPKKDSPGLLWGAAAIATYLGISEAKAFHLLEAGHIPARKVGGRWVSRAAKLDAHIDGTEAA